MGKGSDKASKPADKKADAPASKPGSDTASGTNKTGKEAASPDPSKPHIVSPLPGSKVETFHIPSLDIPDFKYGHASGAYQDSKRTYFHAAGFQRKGDGFDPEQVTVWNSAVKDDAAIQKLREIGFEDGKPYLVTGKKGMTVKGVSAWTVSDSVADVAAALRRPFWNATGELETTHDVDHILELQLGGWPRMTDVKSISNLELLDSSSNRSSGSTIAASLDTAVENALKDKDLQASLPKGKKLDKGKVFGQYDIVFTTFKPVTAKGALKEPSHWKASDINAAKHIDPPLKSASSVISFFDLNDPAGSKYFKAHGHRREEFIGSSKHPVIYIAGVKRVNIDWNPKQQSRALDAKEADAIGFKGASLELDFGSVGGADLAKNEGKLTLTKGLWEYQRKKGDLTIPTTRDEFIVRRLKGTTHAWIMRIPGLTTTGKLKGLSEISFGALDFDGDQFFMGGKILPSLKPLQGIPIEILLRGDKLVVQATFTANDLKAPKPFSISRAFVTLGLDLDSKGIHPHVAGQVDFGIDKVGTGYLKAEKGTDTAFEFEGGFTFDPKLADSSIAFWYRKDQWGGKGTLTVPAKRIPGVKKATLSFCYDEGKFVADGDAELDIPVFSKGHVHFEHSDALGLLINARFDLKDDLPIVKGGFLEGTITRSSAGEWDFGGKGQANLSIAGHSATLRGEYDKGIFDINAEVPFKYKRISGSIKVGATNREYDKDGKPTGKIAPKLHAYGGGLVLVTMVDPWLKGSIMFEVLPTGSWRVVGEVGITEGVPITGKLLDKEFPIGKPVDVDIDLIELVVASVFVNIGGSLSAFANIGALTLETAKVKVQYSPDDESQTRVTGYLGLMLPASAGIKLNLHVGAGVRVLVIKAKVTGNVDVTAQVNVIARVGGVVDWSPGEGIFIGGFASLTANAELTFALYASVRVYVDLWLTTITVYRYDFPKKMLSWKPPLSVTLKMPVTYEQGKPFDVNLSDITIEHGDLDPEKTFTNMFEHSRSEGAAEDKDE